jgi:hypothetical protein
MRAIATVLIVLIASPAAARAQAPSVCSVASRRCNRRSRDQLAAGERPGSFPIPESGAALEIGGLVRGDWVSAVTQHSPRPRQARRDCMNRRHVV